MKVYNIIVKGIRSTFVDVDGSNKSRVSFRLYMLLLVVFVVYLGVNDFILSDDIISLLISTFSIFTALIFGVIFIAPDKFAQRVELYKSNQKYEDVANYLTRYENFAKRFVNLLSLLIVLSIVILIVLAIEYILKEVGTINIILSCCAVFMMISFVTLVLLLVLDIHTMLIDDIDKASRYKSLSNE